jgi:putative transposase
MLTTDNGKKRYLVGNEASFAGKTSREIRESETINASEGLMELIEDNTALVEKIELLWVDSGYTGDKLALAVWLMI